MPEHEFFYLVTLDKNSKFHYFHEWQDAFEWLRAASPWQDEYNIKFDLSSRETRWFFPGIGAITKLYFED